MDGVDCRTITTIETGSSFRRFLYLAAYYILAIVLLTAGALKIYDPSPVLGTLELFPFINNSIGILIATVLPVSEISVGILLITARYTRLAVIAAAGLFWFFLAFSVYGYAAGLDVDCGCFGNVIESDFGVWMILRNALFAAVASMLVIHHRKN